MSNVHQVVIKPHYTYTRQSQWEREKARKKTPIIRVGKTRIKALCCAKIARHLKMKPTYLRGKRKIDFLKPISFAEILCTERHLSLQ